MKIEVVEQGTFKEGKRRNRKWVTWSNFEEDKRNKEILEEERRRNRKLLKQKGGTGNFERQIEDNRE